MSKASNAKFSSAHSNHSLSRINCHRHLRFLWALLAPVQLFSGRSPGRSPISANLRGRDQDRCWWLEKSVPQGPHESSPLRSAGLAFLKSIRPGRDDRPILTVAGRFARPKDKRFDRPLRDGRVFLHRFPALRTGLLSLSPSGTSPQRTILNP
jgi:hypothetical protein